MEEFCEMCECWGHPVYTCSAFYALKKAYRNNQVRVSVINQRWDPYPNTYNLGWSYHPSFSWWYSESPVPPQALPLPSQEIQLFEPPQDHMTQFGSLFQDPQGFDPYSTGPPPELAYRLHDEKLEERAQTLVRSQMTFTAETTQAIGNLRSQLTQLTEAVGQIQQEWETFPSPPQVHRREKVDPLLTEGRVDDRMEDFDSWSESSSEFGG
ncbi:hypothetical protein RHMOL_Rhmol07G0154300 [Rhododendron molle]|uniref:Uncharacterized protein n=1 Tax=Rhododendron molle TaxID=49168 RepID=A0ACC0N1Z3_RHOML|nr:hypothetical protein RHMOL_Rhmol07G0154300 [Rhododendron molle]